MIKEYYLYRCISKLGNILKISPNLLPKTENIHLNTFKPKYARIKAYFILTGTELNQSLSSREIQSIIASTIPYNTPQWKEYIELLALYNEKKELQEVTNTLICKIRYNGEEQSEKEIKKMIQMNWNGNEFTNLSFEIIEDFRK